MKKRIVLLSLSLIMTFVLVLSAQLPVYAAAADEPAIPQDDFVLEGAYAYAVLTSKGELIFFRSPYTYSTGPDQTVTDDKGNEFTGYVYSDVENTPDSYADIPWHGQRSSIRTSFVSEGQTIRPKSTAYWFSSCDELTSFDSSGLDTSETTSMKNMFSACSSLTTLKLETLNTGAVTNMESMFSGCSRLSELNLGSFDTGKVTDMSSMFYGCSGLSSLDVTGFDTSSVTDMFWMFYSCSSLKSLDLSNFDTGNVTSLGRMFVGCSSLSSLDLSGFDTSKATNMDYLFMNCSGLKTLNLSGWDLSGISSLNLWFNGCSSLTSLDTTGWDTSSITYLGSVFTGCSSLTELDLSGWNTENVTSLQHMFSGCRSLVSVNFTGWDTRKVTDMGYMFHNCSSLKQLDLSGFDTRNVSVMYNMFDGCSSLEKLNLSSFSTAKTAGHMGSMFAATANLSEIVLGPGFTKWTDNAYLPSGTWKNGDLEYSNVELYQAYQSNGAALAGTWVKAIGQYAIYTDDRELIFFQSKTSYDPGTNKTVKDINGNTYKGQLYTGIENTGSDSNNGVPWTYYRNRIRKAYVAPGQTITPKSTAYWFWGCQIMNDFDPTGIDTSRTTTMKHMFTDCFLLTDIDLSSWDTSSVTDMSYMFYYCKGLTELDLSTFDTSSVTDMTGMFREMRALRKLDISSFDTHAVTAMTGLFNYEYDGQLITNDYLIEISLGEGFTVWAEDAPLPLGQWNNRSVTYSAQELQSLYPSHAAELKGTWYRGTYLYVEEKSITVPVGGTYQLTVDYDKTPNWNVANPKLLKVSGTGLVTGLYPGTTKIYISSQDNYRRFEVVVNVVLDGAPEVGVLLDHELTVTVPDSVKIGYEGFEGATWTSDRPAIISVAEDGTVTAHRPGTAVITVVSYYGTITDTCTVTSLFQDVQDLDTYFFTPVYWAVDQGITTGYTAAGGALTGFFGPEDTCTRGQIVTFLWRANGSPEVSASDAPKFKDVKKSAYYYKAVLWAATNGITTGYTDSKGKPTGKFGPEDTCTRGQIVTFLWRSEGSPEADASAAPKFKDVKKTDYFYKAVIWAAVNNITTGVSKTKFAPNADCTRAMVVTFLYRTR